MIKYNSVPYNYLPYEFENTSKIFLRWKKLIRSTDFTLGKFVSEFENTFSKYIGAKYCIATNNGTDALILCLKSLGVKKGDEVITVCNTFYATVGAIVAVGAKPVFVDADDRFQIKYDEILKKINKKTKVILPVHWGGASPKMDKIIKIAKKNKIHIVEDACMGIGAKIKNKSPGTFGIINAFSMHPLKSLNVMGDGGMVCTNNKKLYDWCLKYRNHGMINRDKIDFWGVNMRIQPLQAIVALNQLKKLDSVIKKRNLNAKYLDNLLKKLYPNVILPKRLKDYKETFALYMGIFKKRDKLIKFLISKKIECKIHYPIPLHLQKASKKLNYHVGSMPNAEFQAKNLMTIPVHQFLSKKHMSYIYNQIKYFYEKN
ncbi:MAG: hypothetical protein CBE33_05680 [Candidatus Pelagibacter sp. TMED273]|nr:MAG: hypothetical protein CBE33_05680 [Candidatus Pelagibacter sp. TMED273]|tara:strand:+ start:7417 stop:8535 length:1119 start_codon:yes stop_codon:yes gene_type:complete